MKDMREEGRRQPGVCECGSACMNLFVRSTHARASLKALVVSRLPHAGNHVLQQPVDTDREDESR